MCRQKESWKKVMKQISNPKLKKSKSQKPIHEKEAYLDFFINLEFGRSFDVDGFFNDGHGQSYAGSGCQYITSNQRSIFTMSASTNSCVKDCSFLRPSSLATPMPLLFLLFLSYFFHSTILLYVFAPPKTLLRFFFL